jgi:hypothetical protein
MEKTFYVNKENYEALITTWKSKKEHSSSDHVIYNILRCKPADHGFTVKQQNILAHDPWYGFNHAVVEAKWLATVRSHEQGNASRLKHFKDTFGFDMPSDLYDKLQAVSKK